ncbi:UDP-N-acetyl-alpha-D-galactosamine:polypeptide N-acetylgalactosaminyltransferase 13, isoform CRA_b [Rattus norvegicus]|uniref:UDP-N-acetyl-alpha-D-galactosamine:polypeptide N-acetylgalactosaminyltransferase 13, isoform CRA_b n=1 Tax=Rattus norvegicus TaxID=10116 RepID=A6JF41_RAT|nr:UDP-N-acetyl-alpha-D-galactosamine:polypeptide N-acetylgalactosaminyltransferase 13, isoform CRA_b [Rattus norvegicus]
MCITNSYLLSHREYAYKYDYLFMPRLTQRYTYFHNITVIEILLCTNLCISLNAMFPLSLKSFYSHHAYIFRQIHSIHTYIHTLYRWICTHIHRNLYVSYLFLSCISFHCSDC